MQKNPYLILGLTNEATKEEVEQAYRNLRSRYSELRFEEGEIGANASKMLDEIERAYADCIEDLKNKEVVENFGSSYGEIENYIKEMRLEDAQSALDKIDVRDGEWHYYQAQIFYKRQWNSEAKQQLEIACDLDPSNDKYKSTLKRLEKVMNGPTQEEFKEDNSQQRAGYSRPQYSSQQDNSGACCNACSTLICADCCCECCGGDLIPCC